MHVKITATNDSSSETKTLNESTMKKCLTKEFLSTDPYLTPGLDREKMTKKGASCAISDEKKSSGAASWKMLCTLSDGKQIDMTIANTASPQTMHSDILQLIKHESGVMTMRIAMKAKLIGACTSEMP